jgi:hypothetical protein
MNKSDFNTTAKVVQRHLDRLHEPEDEKDKKLSKFKL